MHEFSWAVYPHQGHFIQSDVPVAAYLFNSPLHGAPDFSHFTAPLT
jgi:alpha-mannosidase